MLNEKNSDAILFSFGVIKDHIRLSYTYEKVVSGLRLYSPVTSEFGIQYTFENKRNNIDRVFKFPKMWANSLPDECWFEYFVTVF